MKTTNKKLYDLEKNVLSDIPNPAMIYVENRAEIELNKKANRIRQKINIDIMTVWHDNKLTLEEKQKETLKTYNTFDETEKQIVSKDTDFSIRRLQDILIKYFEATFPYKSREPLLRVTWFFNEMDKLGVAKYMEDSEWHHNRNEHNPEFEDFKWWDNFESKVKEEFPDGIFSEKSFEKTEKLYDELMSKCMREYWQAHPEEFKRLITKLG